MEDDVNTQQAAAERVQMPSLEAAARGAQGEGDAGNLDVILDVPVTIAMEIGRARIPIRNLLQLNQGSVVELERLAGEPLDVLVNGMLFAHGEAAGITDRSGTPFFGAVSPAERVQKLG